MWPCPKTRPWHHIQNHFDAAGMFITWFATIHFDIIAPPTPGFPRTVTCLEGFRLKMCMYSFTRISSFHPLPFICLNNTSWRCKSRWLFDQIFCTLLLPFVYTPVTFSFLYKDGLLTPLLTPLFNRFNREVENHSKSYYLLAKSGASCSTCSFQKLFVALITFGGVRDKHRSSLGNSGIE